LKVNDYIEKKKNTILRLEREAKEKAEEQIRMSCSFQPLSYKEALRIEKEIANKGLSSSGDSCGDISDEMGSDDCFTREAPSICEMATENRTPRSPARI
jgi:hypothetical protein